jgi:hypothetical protein
MFGRAGKRPLALWVLGALVCSLMISGGVGQRHRMGLAMVSAQRVHAQCATGAGTDCPQQPLALTYHGGSMLQSAKLYVVNFVDASNQSSQGTYVDGSTTLAPTMQAISAMASSKYAAWWSEFSSPSRGEFVSAPVAGQVLNLAWMDPSQPGTYFADEATISDAALSAAMASAANGDVDFSGLPRYAPTNVLIFPMRVTQTLCSDSNDCANETQSVAPTFCGYHSTAGSSDQIIPYVVLPAVADRYCGYANESVTKPSLAFDDMTSIMSHEVVETVTDPYTDPSGNGTGWYDPRTQAEVGDACAADVTDPVTMQVSSQGLWVQDLYSPISHTCISSKTVVSASVEYQASNSSLRIHLWSPARVSRLRVWVVAKTAQGRIATWSEFSNSRGIATVHVSPTLKAALGVWVPGSATRMAVFSPINVMQSGTPTHLRAALPHSTSIQGLANATVSVARNGQVLGDVQLDGYGHGVFSWIPVKGHQQLTLSSETNGMRSETSVAVVGN